jgi:hypothetical protein
MNIEKRIIEMPVVLMTQANAKLREDEKFAEKVLKENPAALMYFSNKIQTKFAKQISNTKYWYILQFCANEECQSAFFEKYMDTVI